VFAQASARLFILQKKIDPLIVDETSLSPHGLVHDMGAGRAASPS
jgi:hypothetical protein